MNKVGVFLLAVFLAPAAWCLASTGGGHVVGNPRVSEQAVGSTKGADDAKDPREEKDNKGAKTKSDCGKEKKEGCSAGKGKKGSADCSSDCDAKKEAQ